MSNYAHGFSPILSYSLLYPIACDRMPCDIDGVAKIIYGIYTLVYLGDLQLDGWLLTGNKFSKVIETSIR